MTTDELREAYLDFFVSKGCVRKPSDLPRCQRPDRAVHAGRYEPVQARVHGTGRPQLHRATTCQKCLRTGDIENVGRTSFHETSSSCSATSAFRRLLQARGDPLGLGVPDQDSQDRPERLTITVYLDDDEAFNIWHDEVKVPCQPDHPMGPRMTTSGPPAAPTHGPRTESAAPAPKSSITGNGPRNSRSGTSSSPSSTASVPASSSLCPRRISIPAWPRERAAACLPRSANSLRHRHLQAIVARWRRAWTVEYKADDPSGVRIRRMGGSWPGLDVLHP